MLLVVVLLVGLAVDIEVGDGQVVADQRYCVSVPLVVGRPEEGVEAVFSTYQLYAARAAAVEVHGEVGLDPAPSVGVDVDHPGHGVRALADLQCGDGCLEELIGKLDGELGETSSFSRDSGGFLVGPLLHVCRMKRWRRVLHVFGGCGRVGVVLTEPHGVSSRIPGAGFLSVYLSGMQKHHQTISLES